MIQLRDYQNEARYQTNTLINAKRHSVVVMPTGSGKTKTGCVIIDDQTKLRKLIFVLTPQEEIFNQWRTDLTNYNQNPGYINQEGIKGINRNVYVCMPLSLCNILQMIPENLYPDIIITDECHHSAAASWEKIYKYFNKAVRVGLTATPQRTDGKGLDHLYTDIVQTTNMQELIDNGHLCKPFIIVPEEYKINVPIKNGDYDPVAQAELLGDNRIIGDVIEKYSHVFMGLPVLVACATFEHAQIMTEAFKKAGWQWDHIHSNLHYLDRRKMLRKIKAGELNGLCTVGIGVEGLDIPGLFGLIWLRRTLSLTIYLQFTGRVLRPMKGKKYGIIIDPVGNTFIHSYPEIQRNWTLKGRLKDDENAELSEKVIMKLCPFCRTPNNPENTHCHFCGTDMSKKMERGRLPVVVDGELVILDNEITAEKIKAYAADLQAKQQEKIEAHAQKESELITLNNYQKVNIIKDNLFKNKRKEFVETVKEWL
jgi:superfamily II DNA or RNA helicase